ncbi:Alpha,alpha-trehalose-phosphate synthase (UDP-forming) [Methylophaga frappieri]|uniref:Alpha,alpha-trehalose-phosphate synthase (UDP-forming) n=1 Tax=Methylophaga frappieri (strain ATCC BAA-2434 / DSM 25690 / JAM7) TaxID=754477 RepID=I1YET2_METFJ|nr:HAD-IIB family hydrolase [Methylophaga frappieri]AFJ01425.1 Alpha,alpha-trehalose-phosphate synthase (UDP-forming) [Methylophaga frappieri]
MTDRLLLCTDMDRTVIPNGMQPEHPKARRRFRAFCHQDNVALVYVTGRHRQLVDKAIRSYQLPQPDYVITDVGTKIYQFGQGWQELQSWRDEIAQDWQGYSHQDLKLLLRDIRGLKLQEMSKQNTHKLSYYLPLYQDKTPVIQAMQQRMEEKNIAATVMWSVDELTNIGLIDVLPKHATKLHSIQFLQQQLGYQDHETVFAGDSGNDMPVLASPVQSVLVNNASAEIKSLAYQLANEQGCLDKLYIARDNGPLGMNGNYSAGVLQGVWHFSPAFRQSLQTETFYD